MTATSIPAATWILAALDPVLVLVAAGLGWKADQAGKLVVAVIAALAASVLVAWGLTALGLPWPAPVGRDNPLLLQVRAVAALLWAGFAYLTRRLLRG